jgi:type II secretory pathway pseudopilin PulG
MRWKIIIVNSTILLIVGLLSFALVKATLQDVLSNRTERKSAAERAIRSANMQFELDSLRLERWLSERAAEEAVVSMFAGGTSQARSEIASAQAKRLRDAATKSAALAALPIPIVLFVDSRGLVIGRNDSSQMRGEDLGRAYPSIAEALRTGDTSSQVWLNRPRSEQLLASYAPVRGEGGQVVGMLIAGSPLNDERLSSISRGTSGQALAVAVVKEPDTVEVIAEGTLEGPRSAFEALRQPSVLSRAASALKAGRAIFDDASAVYAAEPLQGYEGAQVLLLAGLNQSLVPSVGGLLWPIFAVGALGILLVVGGGIFLGNYISAPITELEEGLLSVINGRTNHRFELEHPEFGGLVFRINSLLNALMGVPETDSEGRTSQPPGAPYREAEGP